MMYVLPETKALLLAEEDESQTPDDAAVEFFRRSEAKIESEALSGTGTVAAKLPRGFGVAAAAAPAAPIAPAASLASAPAPAWVAPGSPAAAPASLGQPAVVGTIIIRGDAAGVSPRRLRRARTAPAGRRLEDFWEIARRCASPGGLP